MKKHFKWLLPLFLFFMIAPCTPYLDLYCARIFYRDGHFLENFFTHFLYTYGEYFGFALGGAALFLYLLSWLLPQLIKIRKGALMLVLTLVLGAGIVTNTVLKEYWSRPRPKQVKEFGGKADFKSFYHPDFKTKDPQKSFPSGHATIGFYFLSFCPLGLRYRKRLLFISGCISGIFLGGSLSLIRIAQGGHFLSDTLAAALIMWLTALFTDWLVHTGPNFSQIFSYLHRRNRVS